MKDRQHRQTLVGFMLTVVVVVVVVNIVVQMEELVVVGRGEKDVNLGELTASGSPVCKPSSWLGQDL